MLCNRVLISRNPKRKQQFDNLLKSVDSSEIKVVETLNLIPECLPLSSLSKSITKQVSARARMRGNDVKTVRSRDVQCNSEESP